MAYSRIFSGGKKYLGKLAKLPSKALNLPKENKLLRGRISFLESQLEEERDISNGLESTLAERDALVIQQRAVAKQLRKETERYQGDIARIIGTTSRLLLEREDHLLILDPEGEIVGMGSEAEKELGKLEDGTSYMNLIADSTKRHGYEFNFHTTLAERFSSELKLKTRKGVKPYTTTTVPFTVGNTRHTTFVFLKPPRYTENFFRTLATMRESVQGILQKHQPKPQES